VLGEDHQFAAPPLRINHGLAGLHQAGEFFPLAVQPALPHARGHRFELAQALDLKLKLSDSAGGGRLVDDRFFYRLDLGIWRVIEVIQVLFAEYEGVSVRREICAALEHALFAQAVFEPFAAALQRAGDCFG